MPLEFGDLIKGGSNSIFSSYGSWFSSPFLVALLITFIVILIILVMYPAKSNASLIKIFKMFLYVFIGTFVIVFLHDGCVEKNREVAPYDFNMSNLVRRAENIDIKPQGIQPEPKPQPFEPIKVEPINIYPVASSTKFNTNF